MTLSTHVYLLTEADPRDVFFKCRDLLGATDAVHWEDDREPPTWRDSHRAVLRNRAGSGLNALLWVSYHMGGEMLRANHGCDADCEDDCTGTWHEPPHWVDVDFDTAYGYRGPRGEGCGVLHAQLVSQLGEWLDAQGIMWAWRNEFTGEVHIGDRYERLFDLMGKGDEARAWFEQIVVPVIERLVSGPRP